MAFSSMRDDVMEDWGGRPDWVERAARPTPPPPCTRKEPAPVSALTESPIHYDNPPPGTCACGCGKTPAPGRRFASRGCAGRASGGYTREKRAAKAAPPPKTSSNPALEQLECGKPEKTPGRPALPELDQVKAFLRRLTAEGRAALLELVAAEERCQKLGVA